MTSHFTFLPAEWPSVHEAAARAEQAVHSDPRAACFYARRALEIAVAWLYKVESRLRLPYQDNLSALIHEPRFRQVTGDAVFYKARTIKDLGNLAVHSHGPVRQYDALMAVQELFHVSFWLRGIMPKARSRRTAWRLIKACCRHQRRCRSRRRTSSKNWRRNCGKRMRASRICCPAKRSWMRSW